MVLRDREVGFTLYGHCVRHAHTTSTKGALNTGSPCELDAFKLMFLYELHCYFIYLLVLWSVELACVERGLRHEYTLSDQASRQL